jgi:hypothetical protein
MLFAIAEMRSSLESMLPVNGCYVVLFNTANREPLVVFATVPDSVSYLNDSAFDNYCKIPNIPLT